MLLGLLGAILVISLQQRGGAQAALGFLPPALSLLLSLGPFLVPVGSTGDSGGGRPLGPALGLLVLVRLLGLDAWTLAGGRSLAARGLLLLLLVALQLVFDLADADGAFPL